MSLTAEGAGGDRSPRCRRVECDPFCTSGEFMAVLRPVSLALMLTQCKSN